MLSGTDCLHVPWDKDRSTRALPMKNCGHQPGSKWSAWFNTGVMLFRARPKTMEMMSEWRDRMAAVEGDAQIDDQLTFNQMVGTVWSNRFRQNPDRFRTFYPLKNASANGRVIFDGGGDRAIHAVQVLRAPRRSSRLLSLSHAAALHHVSPPGRHARRAGEHLLLGPRVPRAAERRPGVVPRPPPHLRRRVAQEPGEELAAARGGPAARRPRAVRREVSRVHAAAAHGPRPSGARALARPAEADEQRRHARQDARRQGVARRHRGQGLAASGRPPRPHRPQHRRPSQRDGDGEGATPARPPARPPDRPPARPTCAPPFPHPRRRWAASW